MGQNVSKNSLLANILQSIGAGIFTSAAGFFSSIIVARTLGVHGTASIAIALWIVFFATTIFDLGLAATQSRFIPEAQESESPELAQSIEALVFRRFLWAIIAGCIVLGLAYVSYWRDRLDPYTGGVVEPVSFYSLIVVCFIIHMTYAFAYNKLRARREFSRIALLCLSGMLLQIICVLGLSLAFGGVGALAGYIVGSVPLASVLVRNYHMTGSPSPEVRTRVTRYANSLWLASLLSPLIWSRADLFLVGLYIDSKALGVFAAAATLAALLLQLCQMICNGLLPNLVRLTAKQAHDTLQDVSRLTVGILLLALYPICFGISALAPILIALLYGKEFADASGVAVLLGLAAAASSTTIVCSNVLNLVEKNTSLILSGIVGAVLTIVVTIWALPRFGFNGAATARIVSQAAVAAITLFQLRMHLPGSVSWSTLLAKLIASALCFCAATYFVDPCAPVRSLVLAIIAGAATYVPIVTALLAISPSGRQEISFLRRWFKTHHSV
ncbi:MAG: hypothetical protein CL819_04160 [Croceicoccus sp.]|nr:hypothetical protein [Croceicoccus sp.]